MSHLRYRPALPGVAAVLLGLAFPALGATSGTPQPRELFLAGGALGVCSDLAPRACTSVPDGVARLPARHRLDTAGITRALDPVLWRAPGAPPREAVAAMLALAAARHGDAPLDAIAFEDALSAVCLAGPCADIDPQRPWSLLLDAERGAILTAHEQPQRGADGRRPTERAHPSASRVTGGVQVLDAFVAAAQARASGRPKIAVVTASAFDPMDAVDVYLDVFRQLGADALWWPMDGALAAARFERNDCDALPMLRRERLRLPQRETIYPDLDALQRAFCASQTALMPPVQGVFFAGGDQWRHRQAFVQADGRANGALRELQQAYAAGRVVVGGTSAGAAVQSGAWMLSNGDVQAAVSRAARVAMPPEAGCARGRRCDDVPEDALTLWPEGGLRLAEDAIVDTHFSERARELRLLMAMQAADARWGYGVDEASALRVRQFESGDREIEALGEAGGWVFRRDATMRDEVEAWYLAPGATLMIEREDERVHLVVHRDGGLAARVRENRPATAFEPGALRAMAQLLAQDCYRGQSLPAPPGTAELRCADGVLAWNAVNGWHGVGPLRLRFVRPTGVAKVDGVSP